jgi:hypothetical protein
VNQQRGDVAVAHTAHTLSGTEGKRRGAAQRLKPLS